MHAHAHLSYRLRMCPQPRATARTRALEHPCVARALGSPRTDVGAQPELESAAPGVSAHGAHARTVSEASVLLQLPLRCAPVI
eukprot:2998334-Pleurochrysis_carterae.AAC.1